jgi:hypothetical protein
MRGEVLSEPDGQAEAAWAGAVLDDELVDGSLDEEDLSADELDEEDDSALTLDFCPARLSVR